MPSPLVERWSSFSAGHVAIRDASGAHTFGEIDRRAKSIAAALLGDRATLSGERVALLSGPTAELVAAFFGALLAGGSVVVLSPLHPAAETEYFCDDAEVKTILVSTHHAAHPALAKARNGRRVLVVSEIPKGDARPAPVHPHDAALQLYTSGTTGKPKGAVLSHENLAVQADLLREAWGWSEEDTLLHALPLHHMHGLAIALLTALFSGASARLLAFDAAAIWEGMADATVFMAVPTMYAKLFAAFDRESDAVRARWTHNARSLRLATSGSAALPKTLAARWREITGTIPLERFGMTEIGVGLTNPLHGERRAGSVGFALPTVQTRIVDDLGQVAESGELWIRGPSVFSGYYKKGEETRRAFAPDPDGGAPWFKTGDTVTRDESGAFKILGRTSVDILKSGGYKLSALEIEEVLRDHPAVLEVAVVGIPDETWGERVVACVVPRPGREAACTEDALRTFAKERLAAYKVPKTVVAMSELPRNAMGKVVKPDLARAIGSPK